MTAVLPPRTARARPRRIATRRRIDPARLQPVFAPIVVRWPIDMRDVIRAEHVGCLPVPVAKLLEQARAQGYAAGRWETLDQVAANIAELDLLGQRWRDRAREDGAVRWARERAEREAHAAEVETARNVAAGRHPGYRYRGGPVDWLTGLPAGSACAWLRNKRRREAEAGANVTVLPVRGERAVERQVAA